jgi:hypothetical protein
MTFPLIRLAGTLLLCLAATAPCRAEGSASSASSAGSASVGSLSDSVRGSSNSSSRDDRVAEGDYRIVEVAELAGRPGQLRLTLQAAAANAGDEPAFFLDLPKRATEQPGLARGDVISARHRPYGLEFARADTRQAFFLALADDWFRELDPRAVSLQ